MIPIADYDYELPEERIARFPLSQRDASKLLIYGGGKINETLFHNLGDILPSGSLLVFNDTKVIRARLLMHRATGGQVEIFCLEPAIPADYERAFAVRGNCRWHCIIGGGRRWRDDALTIEFGGYSLSAWRGEGDTVRFEWDAPLSFGQLLELLGRTPIPPYLRRESEAIDEQRYQTVYARWEGSVAAPTAGLHFTERLIDGLRRRGIEFDEVTLHVGAGTFLPVKGDDAACHRMHTEHFEVRLSTLRHLIERRGEITAVGTTSVRTLESLSVLGWRIKQTGTPSPEYPIGQWEAYGIAADAENLLDELAAWMERTGIETLQAATRIMIRTGFIFRVVNSIITNFHQPRSTLLLLVSAFIGDDWHRVYDYALANNFRFLSYGDSSLLRRQ